MNEVELLKKMADAAKKMPVPQVDVVGAVRRRMAGEARPRARDRSWPVALGLCAAAAALVAVAVQTYLGYAEPLAELLLTVEGVLI